MRAALLTLLLACSKDPEPPPSTPAPPLPTAEPAEPQPALSLAVTIDGTPATWGQDVFDRVPHFTTTNNGGKSRDTWSVRELAKIAGPSARVVMVNGATKEAIDAAAWADATRIPIVHRTRRGALKFRWTDKDGKWAEAEVKDVVGFDLVTK